MLSVIIIIFYFVLVDYLLLCIYQLLFHIAIHNTRLR